MANEIRVLIVDDSKLFSKFLKDRLDNERRITVVGMATDAYDARDKILSLKPDVMTLDVEMPKMDGIQFLKKLLPQYYIPVVMVSSVSENVFGALEAGAVDFVEKPRAKNEADLEKFARQLSSVIKISAESKKQKKIIKKISKPDLHCQLKDLKSTLIAIGASTGGTEAIKNIIEKLPAQSPPVVIVQHMPPVFTGLYAKRLNKECAVNVVEATHGQVIVPNTVYIGPGGFQMKIKKGTAGYFIALSEEEKVSGHSPSVDVMFDSIAKNVKLKKIGVILTGMGKDGTSGLLNMRKSGARTIGQDEKTCVVYGMPKVAFQIGAVEKQLPLDQIASEIFKLVGGA